MTTCIIILQLIVLLQCKTTGGTFFFLKHYSLVNVRTAAFRQSRTKVTSVFWRKYTYLTPAVTTHNNFSPLSWSWSFLSNLPWHSHTVLRHTTSPFYAFTVLIFFLTIFLFCLSKTPFAFSLPVSTLPLYACLLHFCCNFLSREEKSVFLTPFHFSFSITLE